MTDYTIVDHISATQGLRDITRFEEVMQLVIETTARHYQLTHEQLHSDTRIRPIPEARHFIFWAMTHRVEGRAFHQWYKWTVTIIGDIFGKDHATVLHANKSISGLAQTSREKYDLFEKICRELFHRGYPDALKKLQNIKRLHVNDSVWK
jgi:chromosomal replication initiation ATPase DnaA